VSLFKADVNFADESLTPFQKTILYVLNKMSLRGWKKKGDSAFSQIVIFSYRVISLETLVYTDTPTITGTLSYGGKEEAVELIASYASHSWKRESFIEEMLSTVIEKEESFDSWLEFTKKGSTRRDVTAYLVAHNDVEFGTIKEDRYSWSFLNGVLFMRPQEDILFLTFKDHAKEIVSKLKGLSTTRLVKEELDPSILQYRNWRNIKTPAFFSILEYQLLPPEVMEIYLVLVFGRPGVGLNVMDNWQVAPLNIGIAGSGKSSMGKVAMSVHDKKNVGILSSNIEVKFGLASIVDTFLWVCLELTKSFALPRSEFQSMISGEEMSISEKFKNARSVVWTVPGLLFGNEYPNWFDSAGSLSRRLVIFRFWRRVVKSDMHLDEKLEKELPFLLIKGRLAYQEFVDRWGNSSIWENLPQYFRDEQDRFRNACNPIRDFIFNSGKVLIGPGLVADFQLFMTTLIGAGKLTFSAMEVREELQKIETIKVYKPVAGQAGPEDEEGGPPRPVGQGGANEEVIEGLALANQMPVGVFQVKSKEEWNDSKENIQKHEKLMQEWMESFEKEDIGTVLNDLFSKNFSLEEEEELELDGEGDL